MEKIVCVVLLVASVVRIASQSADTYLTTVSAARVRHVASASTRGCAKLMKSLGSLEDAVQRTEGPNQIRAIELIHELGAQCVVAANH